MTTSEREYTGTTRETHVRNNIVAVTTEDGAIIYDQDCPDAWLSSTRTVDVAEGR